MTVVQASTDEFPALGEYLARRQLEIDLAGSRAVLLRSGGSGPRDWMATNTSEVLGFRARTNRLLTDERVLDIRDFRP